MTILNLHKTFYGNIRSIIFETFEEYLTIL